MHEAAKLAFPGVAFLVDDPGVRGVNPHELLAVGRIIATVQSVAVLALEHRDREDTQHIDFLWGANRDFMVLQSLNNVLEANGYEPIEGHMVGEQVLAADQHRRPVAPAGPHSEYGLVVNVYCHGESGEEVDPSWLGSLGYSHLVWAGHPFENFYGALLTAYWVRVREANRPVVKWYSDEVNPEYPPHPPCDAMHTAGAHLGVQWHTVKTITCTEAHADRATLKVLYDLVLVSARVARESALTSARETKQMVMELGIPDVAGYLTWVGARAPAGTRAMATWAAEYLFSWGLLWVPNIKVMFHKSDFHAAVRFLSNKGRQQYSFRALQTEIDRMLSDVTTHRDFVYLEKVAPEYFLHYRWNLTLAAFTYNAESNAIQLKSVQQTYGSAFDTANRAVRGIDAPSVVAASSIPWQIGGAIVGHFVLTRLPGINRLYASLWQGVGNAVGLVVAKLVGGLGAPASGAAAAVVDTTRREAHRLVDRSMNWVAQTRADLAHGWAVGRQAHDGALAEAVEPAVRAAITTGVYTADFSTMWASRLFSSFGITALVVAPFMEEGFKCVLRRWGPTAQIAACILLAVSDANSDYNPDNIPWLTIPIMTYVHYRFNQGTYLTCVRRHAIWNLGILTLRTFASWLVQMGIRNGARPNALFAAGDWYSKLADELLIPACLALLFVGARFWFRNATKPENPVKQFDRLWYTRLGDPPKRQAILAVGDGCLDAEPRMVVNIPPENRFVAPFTSADLPPILPDPTVKVIRSLTAFSAPDCNEGGGYYRVFGHSAPMFRPAGSSTNMLAVIVHRLACDVPHQATLEAWWLANELMAGKFHMMPLDWWREFDHVFSEHAPIPALALGIDHLDRPDMVEQWLLHTDPAKRERYRAALEVVQGTPLTDDSRKVKNVQIDIKRDEVLLKYRLREEDKGMIPRPIHNVDPQVAVTVGPDVYAASMRIKNHWRWDADWQQNAGLYVNGRAVTLTYGAGLLTHDLDQWFAYAIAHDGFHILVAGDDSVVVHTERGVVTFIEGDISKCDHSIRRLALEFEYRVLRAGGCAGHVTYMLFVNSSATCVASTRLPDGGTVRVQRDAERNTGGVDTTVGNTTVTGGAHYLACATCPLDATVERVDAHFVKVFAKLGLSLKTRVWRGGVGNLGSTFWGPSFLKGYWYPTDQGPVAWQWGPLPSRMLKISKIMVDPRRVYRRPREGPLSYEDACRRHMAALYLGLRPYAWPRELLEWLHARADPAWTERVPLEEWDLPYRPGYAGPADQAPDAPAVAQVSDRWVSQAAWWYNVAEEELVDWLAHLQCVQVGAFSFHPVWVRMALKDYN